ncbi:preprotein translocase subunit SecY [bacterium SM23_31]|nr:MAG: preprotein translocase subunit SecY [bacterium SM23_31]
MIQKIQSVFKIPELRKRVVFTLAILVVYRVGGHIPVPGINAEALGAWFNDISSSGTLFGLYDMFVGGAFQKATIFALGIMPYISASIIIQLLGAVVPYFQKLQKEGEEGRKKITQLTRYGTVLISAMQAWGVSMFLKRLPPTSSGEYVVPPGSGIGFTVLTVITLTCGTIFIMWLGEQISERGIGNGISLIIMIGIVARYPDSFMREAIQLINVHQRYLVELFLLFIMFWTVAAVILITQGTRKIPVQYAKRVIGRKVYGGQSTHIPMRVTTAGVMPIIFAQSIIFIPQTIATFFGKDSFIQSIAQYFTYQYEIYWIVEGLLIIFFTYFYTAIAFNPVDVADNMKKHGGFIPGVRPGKKTAEFIDNILTKITLPGSIFLALIAVFPYFINNVFKVDYGFATIYGGTGLLIVVGVALDTLQQIESHLLMRHYDGFMKTGRIRGRR